MDTITVTTQDLLDALVTASNAPDAARTVSELAETHGLSRLAIKRALTAYQRAGRLRLHKVRRMAIDGRLSVVTAYTIAPAPRKPNARR